MISTLRGPNVKLVRSLRRLIPLAAVAGLAVPAAAAAWTDPSMPQRPSSTTTWIGRLVADVRPHSSPDPASPVVGVVPAVAPLGKGITTLMILDRRPGADGRLWVRVLLPRRPNGTSGWVPAESLTLMTTPLRIRVDLSSRRLFLYRSGRLVRSVQVAVGTPETPTPTGLFAVAEMIHAKPSNGFLGPIVFPLTGFSDVLNEYAGGNGRVAMHGTSLPELIGTRASHGCVRILNRDVVALSRIVRPGVPVRITP